MGYFLVHFTITVVRVCISIYLMRCRFYQPDVVWWYLLRAFPCASVALVTCASLGLAHLCVEAFLIAITTEEVPLPIYLFATIPLIFFSTALAANIILLVGSCRPPRLQEAPGSMAGGRGESGVDLSAPASKAFLRQTREIKLPKALVDGPAGSWGVHSTCAICLEDFLACEQVAVLPCGHTFHSACAAQWLRRELRCPLRCQPPSLEETLPLPSLSAPPPVDGVAAEAPGPSLLSTEVEPEDEEQPSTMWVDVDLGAGVTSVAIPSGVSISSGFQV
jgi:hypothetical protein